MAHTARRWSGLVDIDGADGRVLTAVRAHISMTESSAWHGALLTAHESEEPVVGVYSLQLDNGTAREIIVGVDGTFVGVGSCPIEL